MSEYRQVKELVDLWNAGKLDHLDKSTGDKLAAMAYEKGLDFKVEQQPLKNLAFNLADTASFGLLPDKYFKPRESIGTSIYGTGLGEDIAGGLGSVGGLLTGGAGLLKLAGYAGRGLKGAYGAWKGGSGASGAVSNVSRNINPKLLPSSNKPYQLGQGNRLGLPRAYGSYGDRYRLPPFAGRTEAPTILQLTQGGKMPGPGMAKMIDNMGRNYPSNVLPRYM